MHGHFCGFTLFVINDTLISFFFYRRPINVNLFFIFHHKSVLVKKKFTPKFEIISAHVILFSGFDLNADKPVNSRMQCGVCIVLLHRVFFLFLQVHFSNFTYC